MYQTLYLYALLTDAQCVSHTHRLILTVMYWTAVRSLMPYWLMHGMHPNPARVNFGASPTPTSYCSGDEDGDFEDYNGDEHNN